MKPLIFWSILAMLLMIGCPWLAATFAGSAGMAVCLLLFFGVNPIFVKQFHHACRRARQEIEIADHDFADIGRMERIQIGRAHV